MVSANHSRWSALLVEPDRHRMQIVTDLLRDLGCAEVLHARDADEALAVLGGARPRIILVAARLEPVDGFEFTRRFRRATNVRSNETSVVLTFPGVDRNDVLSALNAGADAVLPFPMSRNQLAGMLSMLDTQKRPFVRAAHYVGPCRRRGLVGEGVKRRLEDFGAPEELRAMVEDLRHLFDLARRGGAPADRVAVSASMVAEFLRAAREGIDDAALSAHCLALTRQFATHAPAQPSFEHAFAPLRKLLLGVLQREARKAA